MKRNTDNPRVDKRSWVWAAALAAVCLVCAAAFIIMGRLNTGTVAVVRLDGEEVYRVDLAKVTQSYDYELDTEFGHNTIHIEPGAISVSEADCPDQVCVRQGAITQGGVPIICMPHHLSVRIEGGGIDA